MKFDNLSEDEKFEYFWLAASDRTPRGTFLMLGVKYDEDWERKSKGELDEYFKKYYPAAYKKAVQIGYKESMDSVLLSGTPKKGYQNIRKTDIVSAVAKKANTTKKAASEVINVYWDVIKEKIKTPVKVKKGKGKKAKEEELHASVNIPNVGSIRLVETKARKYKISGLKNTKKGKGKSTVEVPSKLVPKFYVSDNFLSKTTKNKAKSKTEEKPKAKAKTRSKTKGKGKSKTK